MTLCGTEVTIIADDSAPGGAVIEIGDSQYEGIDLRENEDTDGYGRGFKLTVESFQQT